MLLIASLFVLGFLKLGVRADAIVNCPVPLSPEHGQTFLYREGRIVKFVCEPGYVLNGKELVHCIDGQWEAPTPQCLKIGEDAVPIEDNEGPLVPPSRPLFNWNDATVEKIDAGENSTDDEKLLSDEARVHMVLYPRRQIVTSHIQTASLHSGTELEEEEKKRSNNADKKKGTSSATIHLENHPLVYVRRGVSSGALQMMVDNGNGVEVVAVPRSALSEARKGEENLRHAYWLAHHYYPRSASLIEYRNGNPVVMTLTESQLAWINSMHPDLREQYLKDLYATRAKEVEEGARAQAFLQRYGNTYAYVYNRPYFRRQPLSLIVEDPISLYDYSCNEAYSSFVKAPRLPNAHIARYDKRQNPNTPYNHYLSAVYRCNTGYMMLDTRHTELHCSKKQWIGVTPVCIPRI